MTMNAIVWYAVALVLAAVALLVLATYAAVDDADAHPGDHACHVPDLLEWSTTGGAVWWWSTQNGGEWQRYAETAAGARVPGSRFPHYGNRVRAIDTSTFTDGRFWLHCDGYTGVYSSEPTPIPDDVAAELASRKPYPTPCLDLRLARRQALERGQYALYNRLLDQAVYEEGCRY